MRGLCILFVLAMASSQGAVMLDRIAVVVGKRAIKTSDIDREIRVEAFLNNEKPSFSAASKKQAAGRLVDQEIIRNEIETGTYSQPSQSEVDGFLRSVVRQRFGTEARFAVALSAEGLTRDELRKQLAWQLNVLHFINQRFRPAVMVTDGDVRQYYDRHRAEFRGPFEQEQAKAREALEGEQINQQFFAWLDEQRKQMRVEYREAAFQS